MRVALPTVSLLAWRRKMAMTQMLLIMRKEKAIWFFSSSRPAVF